MPTTRGREWDRAWPHLAWVLVAAALGLGASALFSGVLRFPRTLFLVPYVASAGVCLLAWGRQSRERVLDALRCNLVQGCLGALVAGSFTVWSVLRQPGSPRPEGAALAFDLLWLGLVYGTVDGLLLSVLPVASTWRGMSAAGFTASRAGQIGTDAAAVAASIVVTTAYHLGYAEFRGPAIVGPIVGCGAMSLAYVISRNPIAPVASHVAMHVAAVLHGMNSTVQLPPHG